MIKIIPILGWVSLEPRVSIVKNLCHCWILTRVLHSGRPALISSALSQLSLISLATILACLSTGMFQDTASHWLKSLQQQMSEAEAALHRPALVQRFPLANMGGWPPHTYNPPPGFRAGLSSQQTSDTHKMAEGS